MHDDHVTSTPRDLPEWLSQHLRGRPPGRATAKVLEALASQPRRMSYASTAEAARIAEVNAGTVVRAAQLLGFTGWPQLRAETRSRYLSRLSASQVLDEHNPRDDDPLHAGVLQDLDNLRELAEHVDLSAVRHAAQLVYGARTSLTLGSGSFAAPAVQLSHLGQTIGYDIRPVLSGGTGLLNAVALLQPGDCLLAYQVWKTPREILDACSVAKDRGASLVVVSDQRSGAPTSRADVTILVPSEGASMFPSLVAAMSVTQALLASVIDLDRPRAQRASDDRDAIWGAANLFPPLSQ